MTNKLKPFNLEAALKGEPVMLRDGSKAFVRHHETEQEVLDDCRLWGVVAVEGGSAIALEWSTQGKWRYIGGLGHNYDIIGMYPNTRIINGFEVPAPETKEPKKYHSYFVPSPSSDYFYAEFRWDGDRNDSKHLQRGLVFLTKKEAIANAKAMLGIGPYE